MKAPTLLFPAKGMSPAVVADFQSVCPEATIVVADSPSLAERATDANAIFGLINPQMFRAARNLQWVQAYTAGVEHCCFPELIDSDVVLTNFKVLQGPNVADHALSMLLALTRDLHRVIPARANREWRVGQYRPIELRGKVAVVVGVGGIGSHIAERARAFGMTVIGVDPKNRVDGPISELLPPEQMDRVLPRADVVFIAAPLTRESERMIGGAQFELMKKGAYFIAISRGKLYDSGALVQALQDGRLAGAGLDVTDPEPLPPDHPLWQFENVILTPHMAGQSDAVAGRRLELIKQNIARFMNGEPLLNVVDKAKGY